MREKLRKYGSDILYYSLSFIATLIVWLAHDLDRIGVLKEVDFALELMWWLILMLFAWAGELLPVEEPDYGPEINRRNRKIVAVTEIVLTVLVTAIFIAQLVTGEMFLWRKGGDTLQEKANGNTEKTKGKRKGKMYDEKRENRTADHPRDAADRLAGAGGCLHADATAE